MHAVAVRVLLSDPDSAQRELEERIVPRVSGAPGFVAAYWTRSDDKSNGQSMLVFESEDAARAVADRISADLPEGVTIDSLEVREVVASA